MSVPSSVVRELGCEVRCFKSVQGAMRWYWRRGLADLSPDGPPDPRCSLASAEAARDRDAATSVLIGRCLEADDPEIDRYHLHYAGLFIAWCCSFDNQRDIADERGMTLSELRRTMRFTETVVAMRMRVRRLLA
ncbi:MAG TPA: hypothetical protein VGI97_00710 [Gemmatimonadaceae bacterium]|jgi:hypothetical protein